MEVEFVLVDAVVVSVSLFDSLEDEARSDRIKYSSSFSAASLVLLGLIVSTTSVGCSPFAVFVGNADNEGEFV